MRKVFLHPDTDSEHDWATGKKIENIMFSTTYGDPSVPGELARIDLKYGGAPEERCIWVEPPTFSPSPLYITNNAVGAADELKLYNDGSLVPPMDPMANAPKINIGAPVCDECQGTGVYQGFNKVEPCSKGCKDPELYPDTSAIEAAAAPTPSHLMRLTVNGVAKYIPLYSPPTGTSNSCPAASGGHVWRAYPGGAHLTKCDNCGQQFPADDGSNPYWKQRDPYV